MTEGMVVDIGARAIYLTLLLAGPLLGFGLIAGVLVSIFQAVTSIQEMTLTFIPKILAVILALILFGNWMLQITVNFSADLLMRLPEFVR
ncbi:MAG: flagellar biosynthesis protein FliQ [bacterium]